MSARAATHVAFVIPNLDLAPAAPGNIQPRRTLLRATPERDDDRHVRQRLRVELQCLAAGVSTPSPQRSDCQLQLHACSHDLDVSRRRTTSTSSSASTPTSMSATESCFRPTTSCLSGDRSPAPCKGSWPGGRSTASRTGEPACRSTVTNATTRSQHQRGQRSAQRGRRRDARRSRASANGSTSQRFRAADQHHRQRPPQHPSRPAAARLDLSFFKDFALTGTSRSFRCAWSSITSPTHPTSRIRSPSIMHRASEPSTVPAIRRQGRYNLQPEYLF